MVGEGLFYDYQSCEGLLITSLVKEGLPYPKQYARTEQTTNTSQRRANRGLFVEHMHSLEEEHMAHDTGLAGAVLRDRVNKQGPLQAGFVVRREVTLISMDGCDWIVWTVPQAAKGGTRWAWGPGGVQLVWL